MTCWNKLAEYVSFAVAFVLEERQNTCLRSSEIADWFLLHIAGSEFVVVAVS